MTLTHAALLDAATARLAAASDTARLDAEVLLGAVLGLDRARLYARLTDAPDDAGRARFRHLLERRAAGEPVAYLTGEREFWSLSFTVTPDVLIPRPETEILVDAARARLAEHPAPLIADIGSGSGCIAVALARELPRARLVATDVSAAAVAVARANATRHGVAARIHVAVADLLAAFDRAARFDAIVSNPPYAADGEPLPIDVGYEPDLALRAGPDGLAVIRRLLSTAPAHLRSGGWLLVEIGCGQADAVRDLATNGAFGSLSIRSDFAGIPRVLMAQRA